MVGSAGSGSEVPIDDRSGGDIDGQQRVVRVAPRLMGVIAALCPLDFFTEHCVNRGIDGHKQFTAAPDPTAQFRDDGLQRQVVTP